MACTPHFDCKVQLPAGLRDDELRKRIASTALDLAEKIKGKKYDV